MTREEVIKNLDALYPLTCKMVNGRYKGGFRDMESSVGQTISMAIRSLEAWDKVLTEVDNGLVEARQLQARDYCSGADFVLDIINKHLQEVEK